MRAFFEKRGGIEKPYGLKLWNCHEKSGPFPFVIPFFNSLHFFEIQLFVPIFKNTTGEK